MVAPAYRTVMFLDMRDSTRLYEALGDAAAEYTLRRAFNLCARQIQAAQGTVVRSTGDGLLAFFNDAAAALAAAQQIQVALRKHKIDGMAIGVHGGHVLPVKGDLYGDVVNVAARLCALALGGEILSTTETAQSVPAAVYANVQNMDSFFVKGRREPVHVVKVHWNRSKEETAYHHLEKHAALQSLWIEAGSRSYVVGVQQAEVTVGRADADILIADTMVSRRHAVIKHMSGRFVLTDQSLNGTFIRYDTAQEVFVRRESVDIVGAGAIGFGNPTDVPETRVLFRLSNAPVEQMADSRSP
jgi:adenylate cyclase